MKLAYPFLIDGGLSNELERLGEDLNHDLWSAKLIDSNPDVIVKTHLAYLKAGSRCITTTSYQATFPGLMSNGYTRNEAKALLLKSTELAEIAKQQYLKLNSNACEPIIAASFGPYGAYLANGSEYRGDYEINKDALFEFHKEKLMVLEDSNCDVLAFETIPSFVEAQALSELLEKSKKPAWISFSCKDGKSINDGTTIKKAVTLFKDHPRIFAVGVNCTAPKYITELIHEIKSASIGKKIIVYPNSGEAYHVANKEWLGLADPGQFNRMMQEWLKNGADIVGGCCRIGPTQIQRISQHLYG